MQHQFALVPARADLLDDRIGFFQTQGLDRSVNGLLDELGQGHIQAANRGLRFGRLKLPITGWFETRLVTDPLHEYV